MELLYPMWEKIIEKTTSQLDSTLGNRKMLFSRCWFNIQGFSPIHLHLVITVPTDVMAPTITVPGHEQVRWYLENISHVFFKASFVSYNLEW